MSTGKFIGKPGETIMVRMEVRSVEPMKFRDGPCEKLVFQDDYGNEIVWFTRKNWGLKVGTYFGTFAKVTKHVKYNGKRQTCIGNLEAWGEEGLKQEAFLDAQDQIKPN